MSRCNQLNLLRTRLVCTIRGARVERSKYGWFEDVGTAAVQQRLTLHGACLRDERLRHVEVRLGVAF